MLPRTLDKSPQDVHRDAFLFPLVHRHPNMRTALPPCPRPPELTARSLSWRSSRERLSFGVRFKQTRSFCSLRMWICNADRKQDSISNLGGQLSYTNTKKYFLFLPQSQNPFSVRYDTLWPLEGDKGLDVLSGQLCNIIHFVSLKGDSHKLF